MQVRDGMSTDVVSIGPAHTLREAAKIMSDRRVGSAVVLDGDTDHPGILTERDILASLPAGQDPDAEKVGDHLTEDIVVGAPDWSVHQAAETLVRRSWRHLVVCEGDDVVGILSVRDVVQLWVEDRLSGGVAASSA
jgi:CBS domain-containing protein